LPQIVDALHSSCGFSRGLHRWQEQRHQDRKDRYDYTKFDDGKSTIEKPVAVTIAEVIIS
jgi:hypothetical protein